MQEETPMETDQNIREVREIPENEVEDDSEEVCEAKEETPDFIV